MTETHDYTGYSTRGCRCAVCREAKREYMRQRRAVARKAAQRFTDNRGRHFVPNITHGRFGYEERGCRCRDCTDAVTENRRALPSRARRLEAS